jgi:hypothetical protein
MTQVYPHPEIEDHFIEYDFAAIRRSPPDGGPNDLRRVVMQEYIKERCVLIRNVQIEYDQVFVRSLKFPHTWSFKKFASRVVEPEIDGEPTEAQRSVCEELCRGDWGLYRQFAEEVRRVNGGIRKVLDEILQHHVVTKRDIVWRHTETRVENLHFDIDKNSGDFESVRMYFNMDDVPRIWHTTHGLTQLLAYYYQTLDLASMKDEPLERLLHRLTIRLFGDWGSRGREQFPRHMALFEPNDVWIVDGRTVPHQVLYGRRVASTFYRLDQNGLPPWHPSLKSLVSDIHRASAEGHGGRPAPYDMQGYHFPFSANGPPSKTGDRTYDLKGEWETMYRESIQEGLVRL